MANFFSSGPDYFSLFETGIGISDKAAKALQAALADHEIKEAEIRKLKEIEHEGDRLVHDASKLISDAFITPIERPDMMNLVASIEALTDSIDGIASQIYMMHIKEKDEISGKFIGLLVEACGELSKMIALFKQFKKSQAEIHRINILVNHIEEEGDALFTGAIRDLFDPAEPADTFDIIRRQNLYNSLEDALDCCEDVADLVESIIIANT